MCFIDSILFASYISRVLVQTSAPITTELGLAAVGRGGGVGGTASSWEAG